MKKLIISMILTGCMMAALTACGEAAPAAPVDPAGSAEEVKEAAAEEKEEAVDEDPCKDGHKWVDATCTEPKTCQVCGITEGEPLGHEWLENTPNYQQAKICGRCDETEGEPSEAEFEKKGFEVVSDWNKEYDITAVCHDDESKTTQGKLSFTNFRAVPSDDELGLKEAKGYEWLIFDQVTKYGDENAVKYGFKMVGNLITDYYDTGNLDGAEGVELDPGKTDIDEIKSFSVNYNGEDYPECKLLWGKYSAEWNEEKVAVETVPYYIRVPAGYDGIIISNGGEDAEEIYKKFEAAENAKEIDLIDNTWVNFRIIPNEKV